MAPYQGCFMAIFTTSNNMASKLRSNSICIISYKQITIQYFYDLCNYRFQHWIIANLTYDRIDNNLQFKKDRNDFIHFISNI